MGASTYIKCESQSSFSNKNSKNFEFFSELIMADENDEIDVPDEVKNSLEVTPKLAEAFPEAITLYEALNCRICRSHIKTPMLTKCGHSFCSLCIRTHLASDNNNNKNCPICFKPISALDLIPDIMTSQILGTMGPMAKFFEKLKILAENPEVKEILKDMENEKKED